MKKHTIKIALASLIMLTVYMISCRKTMEQDLQYQSPYILQIPQGFPSPFSNPDNPISNAGVNLGRSLYYDTLLSSGGIRSGLACASCHLQDKGFTLPGQPVLAHVNLAWSRNFLWKGEVVGHLEDIMLFEVNDFFASDLKAIKGSSKYRLMYREAFGSEEINDTNTAYALAQFIRTLISGNSSFDRYLRKETNLSESALRGMELFFSERGDCFHCHGNALFTDNDFHNTGLAVKSAGDMGRYNVTGSSSDVGKFKTPSLRNTALRGAYMHDGRFKTLREVVLHYSKGIRKNDNLDPLLDRPLPNLEEQEVDDLVAFLETLTDTSFLTNKEFMKKDE